MSIAAFDPDVFELVPFGEGESETFPCDECGELIVCPKVIRPGQEFAKCPKCGMVYADADEEENEWWLSKKREEQIKSEGGCRNIDWES